MDGLAVTVVAAWQVDENSRSFTQGVSGGNTKIALKVKGLEEISQTTLITFRVSP